MLEHVENKGFSQRAACRWSRLSRALSRYKLRRGSVGLAVIESFQYTDFTENTDKEQVLTVFPCCPCFPCTSITAIPREPASSCPRRRVSEKDAYCRKSQSAFCYRTFEPRSPQSALRKPLN